MLPARVLSAKNRIDLGRISLLTDEIARSPAEAIAFCRQYGVRWVELRGVPGGGGTYAFLDEGKLRQTAAELKAAGLRVSFLNTPLLKFTLPGTEAARRRNETPQQRLKREERERQLFDSRMEDLRKALAAARIFNVGQVRVFTFTRVADPPALYPKIAQLLDEMVREAEREGVRLLVENEGSCNVATSAELKQICALVPRKGFGINWDPVNALSYKEKTWPEGYRELPIGRVGNVQMKARALVIGPDFVPWKEIFQALERDGYKGKIGLETHVFDGTLIEKAHLCMKRIQELVS